MEKRDTHHIAALLRLAALVDPNPADTAKPSYGGAHVVVVRIHKTGA